MSAVRDAAHTLLCELLDVPVLGTVLVLGTFGGGWWLVYHLLAHVG